MVNIRTVIRISAAMASLLCLLGGAWILFHVGFKEKNEIWTGIGLYFVGKAFFVGPMLLAAAEQLNGKR